jgi:hypothetical protein
MSEIMLHRAERVYWSMRIWLVVISVSHVFLTNWLLLISPAIDMVYSHLELENVYKL